MNSLPSVALLNLPSGTVTTNGDTLANGIIDVNFIEEILVGVNITAITGTATFYVDSLGLDGIWYNLWASAPQSAIGQTVRTISASNSASLGKVIRFRWVVGGGTPSTTFSTSIIGK